MKVIGLIGGMSWESTAEYYRLINESVKAKLGGFHSAKCVLYSVDFAEVEEMQRRAQWFQATELLAEAAKNVERAGADLLLLCTNTMHKVADTVQSRIGIPLLHIADATAVGVENAGIRRVGLLGTRMTMEEDFYQTGLDWKCQSLIPLKGISCTVLFTRSFVSARSARSQKNRWPAFIGRLCERGAEGVILACTELGLLVRSQDCGKQLFDTTRLHALAAIELALKQ